MQIPPNPTLRILNPTPNPWTLPSHSDDFHDRMSLPSEDLVSSTEQDDSITRTTESIGNKSGRVVMICVGAVAAGLVAAVILILIIRCIKKRKSRIATTSTPSKAKESASKVKGPRSISHGQLGPSSKVPGTSDVTPQQINNSAEEIFNTNTVEVRTSPNIVSPALTPNNTSDSKQLTVEGTVTISADCSSRSTRSRKPKKKKKKKPKPPPDPAALLRRATETLIDFWARKDYMSAEDLAIVRKNYNLTVKHVIDDRELDIFTKGEAMKLVTDMITEADRKLTELGVDYATYTYPQAARVFVDNQATPAFIGIRLLAKEYGDYLGATPDIESLPLSGLLVVVFSEKYEMSVRKAALNQIKSVVQEALKESDSTEINGPYPWSMLQQAHQRDPAGFSENATDTPPNQPAVSGEAIA